MAQQHLWRSYTITIMMIPPESEEWHGVCHEPLSSSTLFKILGAFQRKSFQGLDNAAADGAAGFPTFETLVETHGKAGMDKRWCLDVLRKLRDAKRYFKTDFRVHCQQ